MRRLFSGTIITLFLTSILIFAFKIPPVKSSGTIYIRANGSIDPDTAPISTVDNVTYTFTANIKDEIVVEKNNTVVDGAGYSVQGEWAMHSRGIDLYGGSNVTIRNMEIREFMYGIYLQRSSNSTIYENKITENAVGILLVYSSGNTINGNNITINYGAAIELDFSSNNTINENNITNNDIGIFFYVSSLDNAIYHNNFMDNDQHVQIVTSEGEQANFWDDGAGKGNYWSDYEEKHPSATEIDGSGIWNTPYVIDEYNQDNYPIVPETNTFTIWFLALVSLSVPIFRKGLKHF